MTRKYLSSSNSTKITYGPADWISLCQPQPTMEADWQLLLAKSAEPRPGNLRFTINAGHVYLQGELRDDHQSLTIERACQRLSGGVIDPTWEVCCDEIDCLLAETGYDWATSPEHPDQWQAVASDPCGYRCELAAKIIPGGIEVQALIAACETDLSTPSQAAVTRFLVAGHARIRFARFVLRNGTAYAVSFASADRLELELLDSVFAVVAAYRLAWREVRALTNDHVAQAYLEAID